MPVSFSKGEKFRRYVSSPNQIHNSSHGEYWSYLFEVFPSAISVHILKQSSLNRIQEDGNYHVNPNHAYYHQVQAEILFSGRQYGLLYIWTPNEAVAFRIEKEEAWAKNVDLILDFYMNQFIPYVVKKLDDALRFRKGAAVTPPKLEILMNN